MYIKKNFKTTLDSINGGDEHCYVPNVKLRQKPNRRWSEV